MPAGPPWVTASWTGKLSTNAKGDQFSSTPIPGVVIMQQRGDDEPHTCTLGTAVQTRDGQPGFLTAGHCNVVNGSDLWLLPTADISGKDAKQLPGPYSDVAYSNSAIDPKFNAALDAAVVPLRANQLGGASTEMSMRYHVAGVLTTTAAKKLAAGTPICLNGAVTGLHCGVVDQADAGGKLRIRNADDAPADAKLSADGDSGAPVFVLDRQGRAVLVGLVSGGAKDEYAGKYAWATFLEADLAATDSKVILDPDVKAYEGGDYSNRTASVPLNR